MISTHINRIDLHGWSILFLRLDNDAVRIDRPPELLMRPPKHAAIAMISKQRAMQTRLRMELIDSLEVCVIKLYELHSA